MMPQHLAEGPDSKEASVRSHPMAEEPPTASQPADLTPSLLAHARSAVAEKTARGIYTAEFRALLAEPLDIRPDPVVSPDPEITSTRPLTGPAARMFKRAVHRSLRWYFAAITAQVTAHNQAVVELIAEQRNRILQLGQEVDRLRQRVRALEAEIHPSEVEEARTRPPA